MSESSDQYTNVHESLARLRKHKALLILFLRAQIPAQALELASDGEWIEFAAAANVLPPGPETRSAVLADLRLIQTPLVDLRCGRGVTDGTVDRLFTAN